MITTLSSHIGPTTPIMDSRINRPKHRTFYSSPSAASDYFSDDNGDLSPEVASLRSSFNEHHQRGSVSGSMITGSTGGRISSWSAQRALLSRLEEMRADITCAVNLSGHQFQEMNRAFDRVDELFAAPDTQSREPAEIADSGLFLDEADQKAEDERIGEEERQARDKEMHAVVDRVFRASQKLHTQCMDLRNAQDAAQTTVLQATHKIASLESEKSKLQDEISECRLEIERLKKQGKLASNENSSLLPPDFRFHSLVLDKLDKDLEELETRRYSEMVSGQVTPLRTPEKSPLSDIPDLDDLQSDTKDVESNAKGMNGSIHTLPNAEDSEKSNEMATGKSAWDQLWEGLAALSGFHDPEDMK